MVIDTDERIDALIASYPSKAQAHLLKIREMVQEIAVEEPLVEKLEETLKWGEPSFITKHGSTLRMDYKNKNPHQIGLFFSCSTKLVPTFREIFGHALKYEGSRAVLLPLDQDIPEKIIRQCISMALTYHKIKDKDLLDFKVC